jgi:hypothetical protein
MEEGWHSPAVALFSMEKGCTSAKELRSVVIDEVRGTKPGERGGSGEFNRR